MLGKLNRQLKPRGNISGKRGRIPIEVCSTPLPKTQRRKNAFCLIRCAANPAMYFFNVFVLFSDADDLCAWSAIHCSLCRNATLH